MFPSFFLLAWSGHRFHLSDIAPRLPRHSRSSLDLFLSPSLSLPLSLPLCVSLSLCVSVCLSLSLSHSSSSFSLSLSLSLSLSQSLLLLLSLSPPPPPHTKVSQCSLLCFEHLPLCMTLVEYLVFPRMPGER